MLKKHRQLKEENIFPNTENPNNKKTKQVTKNSNLLFYQHPNF